MNFGKSSIWCVRSTYFSLWLWLYLWPFPTLVNIWSLPLCLVQGCRGCCPGSTPRLSESSLYRQDTHPVCLSAWNTITHTHRESSHIISTIQTSTDTARHLTPPWWSCPCPWPHGSSWWHGPCRTASCPRCPAAAAGSLSVCELGWWSSPAASADFRRTTGWTPYSNRPDGNMALDSISQDTVYILLLHTRNLQIVFLFLTVQFLNTGFK